MGTVKMLFAGDFCIRHAGISHMTAEEIPLLAAPVKEMNSKHDISVVNVETVFTDNPTPTKKSGPNISSPTAALDLLAQYNFTVGAFANNHTMDQGYAAGRASFEAVKSRGMECIGFGKNLEEAYKPYRVVKNGKKITVFNFAEHEFVAATEFTPGFAPIDFIDNRELVSAETKIADVIIVYLHAGNEECPYPRKDLIKYTHALIEAGADAVIVSHPHCPQGYEYYNGFPIIYSLGNFFMASHSAANENKTTWNIGYMASLDITVDNKVYFTPIPYEFGEDCSYFRFLEGEKKEKFLSYLDTLSKIITDTPKEEYLNYSHAWTIQFIKEAREGYLDSFINDKAYYDDLIYFIRNCFSCESHSEVFLDYYTLLSEGKLEYYDKYTEKLAELRKRPF